MRIGPVEGFEVALEEGHAAALLRSIASGLGLAPSVTQGDRVRLTPEGLPPIEGVADYVAATFLGVRTEDALYRFHGRASLGMPIVIVWLLSGSIEYLREFSPVLVLT